MQSPAFQRAFTFNNGVSLKNRVLLAPLTNTQSHDDGTLSEDEFRWLEARAKGGFGGLITAASHVQEAGKAFPGQIGSFSDSHIAGLRWIADMARLNGALSILQLVHGGRRAPSALTGVQPATASVVASDYPAPEPSRALTERDRADHRRFRGSGAAGAPSGDERSRAARRQWLPFRAISQHGREQAGRSVGRLHFNRSRLLRETVAAIRRVVPEGFLVGVRLLAEHSAAERGFDIDDTAEVIGWLSELGVNYIHLASPSFRAVSWKYPESAETNLHRLAKAARNGVAVVVAGGINVAKDAEEALSDGADLVAVGKSAILTPDWPSKVLDGGFTPKRFPVTEAELVAAGITKGLIRYLRMINLVKEA